MTRVAAIDCGTNSIRLLITDIDGGIKSDFVREMRIVRLGQGVDQTGRLADEAIARTLAACREYRGLIEDAGVETISFAATSATRDAANAQEFSTAIYDVLGVYPQVLTGEQEATASFIGASRELGEGCTLVIDIGGGSTEFVQGEGVPSFAQSVNIGCVRLTERHLASDPPTLNEIDACIATIDSHIVPILTSLPVTETLIMVAGTATSIAAHALGLSDYDSERIHGSRISFDDFAASAADLVARTVEQRSELGFMHPGRADVIGGGSLIVQRILNHVNVSNRVVVVSERDILDGIALTAAS